MARNSRSLQSLQVGGLQKTLGASLFKKAIQSIPGLENTSLGGMPCKYPLIRQLNSSESNSTFILNTNIKIPLITDPWTPVDRAPPNLYDINYFLVFRLPPVNIPPKQLKNKILFGEPNDDVLGAKFTFVVSYTNVVNVTENRGNQSGISPITDPLLASIPNISSPQVYIVSTFYYDVNDPSATTKAVPLNTIWTSGLLKPEAGGRPVTALSSWYGKQLYNPAGQRQNGYGGRPLYSGVVGMLTCALNNYDFPALPPAGAGTPLDLALQFGNNLTWSSWTIPVPLPLPMYMWGKEPEMTPTFGPGVAVPYPQNPPWPAPSDPFGADITPNLFDNSWWPRYTNAVAGGVGFSSGFFNHQKTTALPDVGTALLGDGGGGSPYIGDSVTFTCVSNQGIPLPQVVNEKGIPSGWLHATSPPPPPPWEFDTSSQTWPDLVDVGQQPVLPPDPLVPPPTVTPIPQSSPPIHWIVSGDTRFGNWLGPPVDLYNDGLKGNGGAPFIILN